MYDRIYQFMKNTNYIIFSIVYFILFGIMIILLDANLEFLSCLSNNMWEIISRLIIGLPLLLQLLLTHIVYRKNRSSRIIRILMIVTVLYTIACGSLALWDLYLTHPNFGDDLIIRVFLAQLLFQIALIIALVISMFFKFVYKKVVLKSVVIIIVNLAFTIIIEFIIELLFHGSFGMLYYILLISSYNPIMLFILCNIAKGRLFLKERYSH